MKKEKSPCHLIFRRCERDQYDERKKQYEQCGVEFASSWYEEADNDDPYPHVHSIVYLEISKKTLQTRLNKHLPQYNNLHVCKELLTPEYLANACDYVCKDWMPLYPEEPDATIYKRGAYNFNKNMKVQAKLNRGEKASSTSHKETFNQTICKSFELWFRQKDSKVSDREIVIWLCETYKLHMKDLDSIIIRRKFWMLKNQFNVKSSMNLVDLVMRDLGKDFPQY